MYIAAPSQAYRKGYKRLSRHRDFDPELLDEVIMTLRLGKKLSARHRDHQLTGEYKEYRECHVKSDILLMYQIQEDILILLLVKIGTHNDLFG